MKANMQEQPLQDDAGSVANAVAVESKNEQAQDAHANRANTAN